MVPLRGATLTTHGPSLGQNGVFTGALIRGFGGLQGRYAKSARALVEERRAPASVGAAQSGVSEAQAGSSQSGSA